jgi:carbamoyltransferase
MNIIGVSGSVRDAAAAITVDGELVAAACEESFTRVIGIGYVHTGGLPAAALEACLKTASMRIEDIDSVAVVTDGGRVFSPGDPIGNDHDPVRRLLRASGSTIDPTFADAVQAAQALPGDGVVVVASVHPPAIVVFMYRGGRLDAEPLKGLSGVGEPLFRAATTLARWLGASEEDPFKELDRLSAGAEPAFGREMADALRAETTSGFLFDEARLAGLVGAVAADLQVDLADQSSLHVRARDARAALAASFICRLSEILCDVMEQARTRAGGGAVAAGGALFGNTRLNTEVRRRLGSVISFAAVPEAPGRALGAALAPTPRSTIGLSCLALGPSFSETEIKRTLDNCRLDYVYEPDWRRLLVRVSKMLSDGKVIAWFQGAMGFGPRSLGTRSILCDPSLRYARENMNEYLRHAPLEEPLPLALLGTMTSEALDGPAAPEFMLLDVPVRREWHERLKSALDARRHARVHTVARTHAPELCDLLECHYERSGVPALIETNLSGPGEPIACTPRDAVRTVYSSAIDALIIGRFVLMKDYWLLRSQGS